MDENPFSKLKFLLEAVGSQQEFESGLYTLRS
jgi:hypothetical protein